MKKSRGLHISGLDPDSCFSGRHNKQPAVNKRPLAASYLHCLVLDTRENSLSRFASFHSWQPELIFLKPLTLPPLLPCSSLKIALPSQTAPTHFWIISALSRLKKKKKKTVKNQQRGSNEPEQAKSSAVASNNSPQKVMWPGQEVRTDVIRAKADMTAAPDSQRRCTLCRYTGTDTHTWPGETVTHTHSHSHNKLRQSNTSSSSSSSFTASSSSTSDVTLLSPSLLLSGPLLLCSLLPPDSSFLSPRAFTVNLSCFHL